MEAIEINPDDKAGYCDLAFIYLEQEDRSEALFWATRAIDADASAKEDLLKDSRFAEMFSEFDRI